jgi:polysaccharide pyruvyl transferase WcaK-like protein
MLRLVWAEAVALLAMLFGRRALRLLPRDTRAFVATLAGADIAIAKGGSYLYAMGGLRELVYLWRMLYPIRMAKLLTPRVVLLGVSIGEFRSRGSRHLAKAVLGGGVELYVRENRSLKTARDELRISPSSVRTIPDLAFLTKPPPVTTGASGTQHGSGVKIGVTVRHHSFPRGCGEVARARYISETASALRQFIDEGGASEVAFIPQVDEDAPLAREVATRLDRPSHVRVVEARLDLNGLLAMYQSLDVLIGARLHSVILAAVVGVPAVHVVYEPSKSEGTLALLHMEEFGIAYEDLTAAHLRTLVRRILDSDGEVGATLIERVAELRSDVHRAMRDLLGLELQSTAPRPARDQVPPSLRPTPDEIALTNRAAGVWP